MNDSAAESSPIKVIHLNLEKGWRGGERQLELLVRELAGAGLSQVLVCRTVSPFPDRLRDVPGLSFLPVEGRLRALRRLPPSDPETVFHAHTANTIPLALIGARGGSGTVATRRLDLKPRAFLLRRVDRVVAISRRVLEVLQDLPLPSERLRLIPSAVDLRRRLEPGTRKKLRGELAMAGNACLGLTVAAAVEQKDPLTLVRALPKAGKLYHHLWVGDGPLLEEARRLADQLGVSRQITFTGFDPDPDRWFAAADLFVLPSRHEGLGSALLDAFHFGIPVVGSAIPASSELLEEGCSALLFPPGESDLLARRLNEMTDDPTLRHRLVEEGKRRVARYDIRRTAREYHSLYGELVAEKSKGPC